MKITFKYSNYSFSTFITYSVRIVNKASLVPVPFPPKESNTTGCSKYSIQLFLRIFRLKKFFEGKEKRIEATPDRSWTDGMLWMLWVSRSLLHVQLSTVTTSHSGLLCFYCESHKLMVSCLGVLSVHYTPVGYNGHWPVDKIDRYTAVSNCSVEIKIY